MSSKPRVELPVFDICDFFPCGYNMEYGPSACDGCRLSDANPNKTNPRTEKEPGYV
jgi:hypothetical protein